MNPRSIHTSLVNRLFAVLAISAPAVQATLEDWQNQVNAGTAPVTTLFTPVSGTAPIIIDVGALTGDRSFEFIVNAGLGGPSSAFLGNRQANGTQGLKFEQWQDAGVLGMTDFGVIDAYSDDAPPLFIDTHVVFASNGADTKLYVNGIESYTFVAHALQLFGQQGLAGIINNDGSYNDVLDGTIRGFASYDTALSAAEIQTHSAAFAVPEPSTFALGTLAGITLITRRRRQLS